MVFRMTAITVSLCRLISDCSWNFECVCIDESQPPEPKCFILIHDCMGSFRKLSTHFSCHYAVFDNLLKIRRLRVIGEIKIKAALPNFGNGVTKYFNITTFQRRCSNRSTNFWKWLQQVIFLRNFTHREPPGRMIDPNFQISLLWIPSKIASIF